MKNILLLGAFWLAMIGAGAVYPLAAAPPAVRDITIGLSAQERPITATVVGDGERKLVVVGDTHGGPEANTYVLTTQLIEYYRANPDTVPADVTLYLIPSLNPDGLALGSRYDAFGIDLNRNMNTNLDTCVENDWSQYVYGAGGIPSYTGGPFPDSQIESRVIRTFLLDASGAIFLHSNAGLVFPASCEHAPSIAMAQRYAEGSGYIYTRFWDNYLITGGMHDWAGSLGIAAITPELITGYDSEYAQNLSGLQAVLADPEATLPLPTDQQVNGITVPAVIWRYWLAHGGADVFGVPITPPQTVGDDIIQTFSNARLVYRAALRDTPFVVQPAPLGYEALRAREDATATAPVATRTPAYLSPLPPLDAEVLYVEETGHALGYGFLDYYRLHGGSDVLGLPISDEMTVLATDGSERTAQYFENVLLTYNPADGTIQPEPIGWQALVRAQMQQVAALHHEQPATPLFTR